VENPVIMNISQVVPVEAELEPMAPTLRVIVHFEARW
jgi:hypothetical protein